MTDNTDTEDAAAFTLPPEDAHPLVIEARLRTLPEHVHLAENNITIGYIMRSDPKHRGNKTELGSVHEVKTLFQGGFKELGLQLLAAMLGNLPQFLVVINGPWWDTAAPIEREALLSHELLHIAQKVNQYGELRFDRDGLPVYGVREHDVTAFNAEVERYGFWNEDLRRFASTVRASN